MTPTLILALFLKYRYAIFVPLAIAEGTTIAFLAGVLAALGILDPLIGYLVLIVGDVIPDTLWYQLGRHAHRRNVVHRFGHHVGMTPARFEFVLKLWRRRPVSTLMLSKLAYGMGAPMLMTAGYAQVPLRLFYVIAISTSAVQYGVLMLLGMGMFRSYTAALPYIRYTELFAACTVGIVLIGAWRTSRAARDHLLHTS